LSLDIFRKETSAKIHVFNEAKIVRSTPLTT